MKHTNLGYRQKWGGGLVALLSVSLMACTGGGVGAPGSSSVGLASSSSVVAASSVPPVVSSSSVPVAVSSASSVPSNSNSACPDAVARGADLYASTGCVTCHGVKGIGATLGGPIDLNAATYIYTPGTNTPLPLNQFILTEMRLFAPGCTGQCPDDVAAYLKSETSTPFCPAGPISGGSSSAALDPSVAPTPTKTGVAVAPKVRRLGSLEYANTIRDLLGVTVEFPEGFEIDAFEEGLIVANQVLPDTVGDFFAIAGDVANDAIAGGAPAVTCPAAQQNTACVTGIATNFGKNAWRRPLTNAEVDGLVSLFSARFGSGLTFNESLGYMVRSILLSPNFVYILEPDGGVTDRNLTAYELATRLSYFLWKTTPDQTLMGLADNGTLLNTNVLSAQVDRMLADPKAIALVDEFARLWLLWDRNQLVPSVELFPNYSPALRDSMVAETRAFMKNLILDENAPVSEMLTADYSFVDGALKALYGLDGAAPNAGVAPIRIQAENYDRALDTTPQNEGDAIQFIEFGVDVQATTDVGGGFNTGYTRVDEFLEYDIDILVGGSYSMAIRVASDPGTGQFGVSIDGVNATGSINVGATGGYQAWTTLNVGELGNLSAGQHTLRIDITGGNFNINWFEIVPTDAGLSTASERVTFAPGDNRQGILTQAAVMFINSKSNDEGIVRRGLWILEELICERPPALPNDPAFLAAVGAEVAFAEDKSAREIITEKTSAAQCVGCHQFINPVGFALSNYDSIGQYRTEETRGSAANGPWTVDASGALPSGETFDGAIELSNVLASSYKTPMCVISKLMTYGIGRPVKALNFGGSPNEVDYGTVYDIYESTSAGGNRFQDIIEAIVLSDAFRMREPGVTL